MWPLTRFRWSAPLRPFGWTEWVGDDGFSVSVMESPHEFEVVGDWVRPWNLKGDGSWGFALLIHSGWSSRQALTYNFASALTFLVGSLLAFAVSAMIEVAPLVAFAAGTFVYIAMADLVPQFTTEESLRMKMTHTVTFAVGLGDCSSWLWSRARQYPPNASMPPPYGCRPRVNGPVP